MEDLTKHQLILVALLVSFVTSIATGIATVALMEQAPTDVTRVINRVIERTVETVTPSQAANVVTTEKTVIVREEDAIGDALKKVGASVVRVYAKSAEGERVYKGLGVIAAKDGTIITDSTIISDGVVYEVKLLSGVSVSASVRSQNETTGLAILSATSTPLTSSASSEAVTFTPAVWGSTATLKLGKTVLAISGREADAVSVGVISQLVEVTSEPTSTSTPAVKTLDRIRTSINSASLVAGAPLLNLFGEVVGILGGTGEGFIPASAVKTMLAPASVATEA